jgi:protein phosphatase
VAVHATSLPEPDALTTRGERLATLMLVADGVGGSAAGHRASRLATEAVARHIASALHRYHTPAAAADHDLVDALRAAADEAHEVVCAAGRATPDERGMATTLSLAVVVWPWLYVLHVGDSRCYVYQRGELRQVTRDQTVAQHLVDEGILSREVAERSPLSHVLSSAVGADARPEVTRVDVRERGSVILVCSDGLTKHASDAEIADHLGAMESAEHACRSLLQLALDRGGTDNITLVVGRALRARPA